MRIVSLAELSDLGCLGDRKAVDFVCITNEGFNSQAGAAFRADGSLLNREKPAKVAKKIENIWVSMIWSFLEDALSLHKHPGSLESDSWRAE